MNKGISVNRSSTKGNKQTLFIAFSVFIFSVLINTLLTRMAFAQESISVAVVNVTYLMENAPQAELASIRLKKKFLPQEENLAKSLDEINTLEAELEKIIASNNLPNIKDLKRQKERELRSKKRSRSRLLQDFREELRFARDAALDDVQKEVFSAISLVRIENKIDIVLQDYVSASQRVDITQYVLSYLKNKLKNPAQKSPQQDTKK